MADLVYERLGNAPVQKDELECLIPGRRRRRYKHLGSIIVFLLSSVIAVCVMMYGNCDCVYVANFKSEIKLQSNSSATSSDCQCQGGLDHIGWLLIITSLFAFDWSLGRITYLLVLLFEELHHGKQFYERNISRTFKFVICSEEKLACGATALVCALSSIMFLYKFTFACYYHLTICEAIVLPTIFCYVIFFMTFNYQEPRGIEQALYAESPSAKIGGGLALWFYSGFLKLVLCQNDDKPSIKQRITEYKESEKLDDSNPFPEKLFILFPTSCYTHNNLANVDSRRIEERQKLKALTIERAGITKRTFNNSVYCVTDTCTDKKYLAVVEYATPLDTLYNLTRRGVSAIHLSSEQRREEVIKFYRELKFLLEKDPACSNMYVLVLYDDENAEDEKACMLDALIKKIKENLHAD